MKKQTTLDKLDFQNLIIEDFFSKNRCKKIVREINKFGKFDDLVMGGRKRINKGSKNFHNFLNQSSESRKFFKNINNFKYFKKIQNYFDKKKRNYVLANNQKKFEFSKRIFGSQSGKKITNMKTNTKKNILYLDVDFSSSGRGYSRGAHRDRDSRVINFLIYLNNLTTKDGGYLKLFNLKNKKMNIKDKRFVNEKQLKLIKNLKAKAGRAIFFVSSPNSYHSASNFYAKKIKRRYFIYGSFSLNKKVNWHVI